MLKHPRLIGDTNPTYAAHWLNKRCEEGKTRRFVSHLEDNPLYFDDYGALTPAGETYIAGLDALTGSRYERLRLGLWVGVENAVYGTFDRERQVVDLETGLTWQDSAAGADYGRVHKAGSVSLTKDQYGRVWVREAWGQPDLEHGETTAMQLASQVRRFNLRKIGTDPTTDLLIGLLKSKYSIQTAKLAEGSRQHRIDLTQRYMRSFTGGAVPSLKDEMEMRWPVPGLGRSDSYGILFVKGAPGIDELCDQLEAYHYEHKQSDIKDEMVVARIGEDLVAALENGIWAMDEYPTPDYSKPLASSAAPAWGSPRVSR